MTWQNQKSSTRELTMLRLPKINIKRHHKQSAKLLKIKRNDLQTNPNLLSIKNNPPIDDPTMANHLDETGLKKSLSS